MVGDRYRIVALLGRGGMGEVYRAQDLTLGQPVALKFVPKEVSRNQDRLSLFHQEVRVARQVTHPNVCRVHDIGEIDGQLFLSMEYVDGEDLASLLRRIGHFPAGKAAELARQLCAGLAAAHDRGVVHGDLKPSNILIDGRGHVRIADFGLASFTNERSERRFIAGTPGYMAPEQCLGHRTTEKTDIFSLGLVLYELFTGRRALAGQPCESTEADRWDVVPPSAIVADIDRSVERIILQCVAASPSERPLSVIIVAGALPGRDPLYAAIAAGETPLPAVVAAAEQKLMSVGSIAWCVAWILAALALTAVLGARTDVLKVAGSEQSPELLEQRARDVLLALGFGDRPQDSEYGLLTGAGSKQVHFWYRQSPRFLTPAGGTSRVSPGDPPFDVAGMIRLRMDLEGRLLQLDALPEVNSRQQSDSGATNWDALWSASRLDRRQFEEANPIRLPLVRFDSRAAWVQTSSMTGSPLRVEAASWQGTPVYFEVGNELGSATPEQAAGGSLVLVYLSQLLVVLVMAVAVHLAWRNWRQGRGDPSGAVRLALFIFACELVAWFAAAHHVPTRAEAANFNWAISYALFFAVAYWVLYMALEPHVRRRWPHSLISWARLLAGSIRDPLVGAHTLIGVAGGVALAIMFKAAVLFGGVEGLWLSTVSSRGEMVASAAVMLRFSIGVGLAAFFFIFLLRALFRRDWPAALGFTIVFSTIGVVNNPPAANYVILWAVTLIANAIVPFVLIRFGLLSMITMVFVSYVLASYPFSFDLTAWYAGSTIFAMILILALTAAAAATAIGRRSIFGPELL